MKRYLPPIAIIAAAILWSFDGLIRQNLSEIPAITIVFFEHLLGALLFAPLLVRGWQEIRSTGRTEWGSILWVSLFGGLLGTFFYTKALSYVGFIDLTVVVLLQKFQPVFAIGLAGLLLREKITRLFLLYASIAMVGGYLLTFPDGLPRLDLDGNQTILVYETDATYENDDAMITLQLLERNGTFEVFRFNFSSKILLK